MQVLPTFVDAVGVKGSFEDDLKSLLGKMSEYNHKANIHKALKDIRIENYFRKHPYIL